MDQTNAQASTIDSKELDAYIDKAVDELFVAKGDSPSPLSEDVSAPHGAERPDRPAIRPDEGKLEPLEQSLLSLDWEVSERNIAELQQRVNELSETLKLNRDGMAIINRMQVVCKYLRACGDTVSPLSIQFLHAATRSLNLLLADPPISDANRRAVMEKLLASYGRLKADAMRLQPAARGSATEQAVVEDTAELRLEGARSPDDGGLGSSRHGTESLAAPATGAETTDLHEFFTETETSSMSEEEVTPKPPIEAETCLEDADAVVSDPDRSPEPTEEAILTLEPEEIVAEPVLEVGPEQNTADRDDSEHTTRPEPTEEAILTLEPEEIVAEPLSEDRAKLETVDGGANEPCTSPETSKTPIPMLTLQTGVPKTVSGSVGGSNRAQRGVGENSADPGQFEDPIPKLEPEESRLVSFEPLEQRSAPESHPEDLSQFEPAAQMEGAGSIEPPDEPSEPHNASDETSAAERTSLELEECQDSVAEPPLGSEAAEPDSASASFLAKESEPREQSDAKHVLSEGVGPRPALDEKSVTHDSETTRPHPRSHPVEQAIERAERLAEALKAVTLETEHFFTRVLRSTSGKPALERVTNAFLKTRENLETRLSSTERIAEGLLEDLRNMRSSGVPVQHTETSATNSCLLQSQVAPIEDATRRLSETIAVLEARLENSKGRSLPEETKVGASGEAILGAGAAKLVAGGSSTRSSGCDAPPDRHVMSPLANPVYVVSVGGRLFGVPVDTVVGVFPVPKRKREKLLKQECLTLRDLKPAFRAWRPELSGALASADASEMAEFEFPILTQCGEIADGNSSRSQPDAGGLVLLQTPSGYGALFTDEVLDRTRTEAAGTVPLVFG